MNFSKSVFICALKELCEEEGHELKKLGSKLDIPRTTWNRIIDPESNYLPSLQNIFHLCDMLNTTIYYLLYKKGPKQAPSILLDEMLDIMIAYTDPKSPSKALLIDMIKELDDPDTLRILRGLAESLISSQREIREKDGKTIDDLGGLERNPLK